MLIKLNCPCGTRFSFDVEPVNGQMPFTVACPTCGADGTPAGNAVLMQTVSAQQPTAASPLVPQPPAAPKARLSVAGASKVAPPVHAASAAAAAPAGSAVTGEVCSRHSDQAATEHCCVCKKPICPECMSMFGYLCSVGCRYAAEQQGIRVPKYKFQKRNVEARALRKAGMITVSVIAVVVAVIAAWYWYDYSGSKPKLSTTVALGNDEGVYSQFLGENQLLLVSMDRARLYDIKGEKDVWSTDLKDAPKARPATTSASTTDAPNANATARVRALATAIGGRNGGRPLAKASATRQPVAAKPVPAADASADDSAPAGDESDYSDAFSRFSDYGRPRVFVESDNVWVCFNTRLKCVDKKTGEVKKTIWIDGQLIGFTPSDSNILLVTAPNATHRLMTRIEIPSGNLTTNEVMIPRPTMKKIKNELPAIVEPTARVLLHQEMADRKIFRLGVVRTSSEFFSSGENLVELRVRLVDAKLTAVESMKKKGPSVVNGQLSASSNTKAVAEEIFNDLKRSDTGGFKEIDESTYAVTLRRWTGNATNDWTGDVTGLPQFFSTKSVDMIIANKRLIAFDKQNKKLFEATLSYGLPEGFTHSDANSSPPALELDGVLYFFDQGVLTAFELPTGNVRWRLPTVGITCIQPDKEMLYINTSSAAPEDIQYSDEIKFDKVDAILLKVDSKTGKTVWKSVNHGQQTFLSGKYVFATSSFVGGMAMGNALRDALGMASSGPSYFHIYRIDPANGELVWDYSNNKDGAPSQVDFQGNKILLNYGKEIRVMKFLQLF
jgi:hypothetical protein